MNKDMLKQQDLAGMDFSGWSLGTADLSGKNLRGADLSNAHLGKANLSGADLRNANLQYANLGMASLAGADLRYSDLREANLTGADLSGADLREAQGLTIETPVPLLDIIRPVIFEETEEYQKAQDSGYFPLAHWGKSYAGSDGQTLMRDRNAWTAIKNKLGESIFGDRKTYNEVRLVRQYKEYSQWAYMISKRGFERIARQMGVSVKSKG